MRRKSVADMPIKRLLRRKAAGYSRPKRQDYDALVQFQRIRIWPFNIQDFQVAIPMQWKDRVAQPGDLLGMSGFVSEADPEMGYVDLVFTNPQFDTSEAIHGNIRGTEILDHYLSAEQVMAFWKTAEAEKARQMQPAIDLIEAAGY